MSKQPYGLRVDSPFDRPDFTEDEINYFKHLTESHITFDLGHFSLELEESSLDLEDLSEAEFFNPVLKNRLFDLIKERYESFSVTRDSFINADLDFKQVSESLYCSNPDILIEVINNSGVEELFIYQELVDLIQTPSYL